ncbi:MAG TPA: glycosyltransferase [Arachnia sp.]|nr:glycosyltransferase [Arachnia sp.]HMT85150.1 glycosyltransferase [Arachnia sp.]
MRVGIIASTGKHLDSFFPEIVEQLRSSGLEVFPASGTPTDKMSSDHLAGMTQSPSLKNLACVFSLPRWVRQRRLDLVVTNTATASFLARALLWRVPVVYFCHGMHWNTGRRPSERIWQALEWLMLRRTAGVVVINSDDRKWVERHRPRMPVLFLRSGVGVPETYLNDVVAPPASPPLMIVWAGDFSERKRPAIAVELASVLKERDVSFNLTMLGDGPLLGAVRDLIRERGMEDCVQAPGRVESILPYLDGCHVVAHTATWEGLPRVLLEAVARRRNVVAFDVKGVRDVPGVICVTENNVDELARKAVEGDTSGDMRTASVLSSRAIADQLGSYLKEFTESTTTNDHGAPS